MNRDHSNYAMPEWWFRHVHIRTRHHKRNVRLVDYVMNSVRTDRIPFQYNKGIMRGCGCNILA